MDIHIDIKYNDKSKLYVAICKKLGLVIEALSFEELLERLKTSIPEMAKANGYTGNEELNITGGYVV